MVRLIPRFHKGGANIKAPVSPPTPSRGLSAYGRCAERLAIAAGKQDQLLVRTPPSRGQNTLWTSKMGQPCDWSRGITPQPERCMLQLSNHERS